MFYKISSPLIALGFINLAVNAFRKIRERKFSAELIVILGTISSLFACVMLTHVNVNRINSIHIYTVILLSYGIYTLYEFAKDLPHAKTKYVAYTTFALTLIYMSVSFLSFTNAYFKNYNKHIAGTFNDGLEEAVDYVNDKDFENIYVDSSAFFPQILFFDKTPTPDYIETVEFSYYPAAFVGVKSFTKYTFGGSYTGETPYDAYIIRSSEAQKFQTAGFTVIKFNEFSVCHI